ncbi:Uncharacterised protein [Legionella busanensis]|uniref:Uncharacterized protein n=1 Tax=Legionella busanensis TaxID=190655 RepID=A0A378KA10_9GAMM|nr:hypothetical protein [Legionella busanensis]STX81547.1 Uncharacterised protein [Legionella busanensis]
MKCNNPWLYLGVIVGYLFGFIYFAFGVYTHSNSRPKEPSGYENHSVINLQ